MAHQNTFRPTSLIILLALLAGAHGIASGQVAVRMDGERLTWQAGNKPLGSGDDWLQVRDLAAGDAFLPVPVSPKGDEFSATVIGLDFSGKWQKAGDAMELSCSVAARPPQDRAVVVRVALPLQAVGWTWWDTLYESRRIEPNKHYSNVMRWGGLRDVSTYMCCAVTGPDTGVSAAVPLEEPRVWRLAFSSERGALEAEFDLGRSPDAAKFPCRADFRLLVYAHDPKWGFRDALRRYYELFPQYAERRVGEGGIWLLSFEPAKMACPWDWGFRFDEGGEPHAGYDCAHDILPFVYTEPWGRYEGFGKMPTPDGKPHMGPKGPILTPQQLKQSVLDRLKIPANTKDKREEARRDWAEAEVNSAIEREDGVWIWHHWTDQWSPGDWISNICLNPDPDLPPPSLNSLMWKRELDPGFETAKKDGGESGGVYLDSVCGYVGFWPENFRREQWKYADTPLVASWKAKKPAQLHCFSCYELGLQVAQRMRAQGKFVMGNTGPPEMAWFCPILDMIGTGEHGIGLQADRHYAYMRAYGYRKPMSPMAYDLVNPEKTWEEKERAMHRLLFYAVHPGTGGFKEPDKYEPSRPLFRYYEPLIIWADLAGWQPVTCAAVTAPEVLVERYGPGQKELAGVTFIAIRNPGKQAVKANVVVEPKALPGDFAGGIAWLMVSDQPAQIARDANNNWTVSDLNLPEDSTEVIALGKREAIAGLWMRQSQQWLDRMAREAVWLGMSGAKVVRNGDFEAGLDGWGLASPPNNARNAEITLEEASPLSGKRSVKVVSHDETSRHGLNQGMPLTAGEEYTLRFKYAWARPDGAKGTFIPRFGIIGPDGKYAPGKYIYFKDVQPTGDKAAVSERRFTIPAGHSVGFFQFCFEGNWGTIRIDDVEMTSQKILDAQAKREQLATEARKAADSMKAGLGQSLLSLIAARQPVYEKLRDMAQAVPDEHARRCLLLPTQNFADSLGHAAEVLTGVTMGLPEAPPFADAALGSEAVVAFNLRSDTGRNPVAGAKITLDGAQGLKLRMPESRRGDGRTFSSPRTSGSRAKNPCGCCAGRRSGCTRRWRSGRPARSAPCARAFP